jgi:hypothetical protein
MKASEGMQEFLAIERKSSWEQFSAGFWDDYLECATVTDMPSHAVRAGDHTQFWRCQHKLIEMPDLEVTCLSGWP